MIAMEMLMEKRSLRSCDAGCYYWYAGKGGREKRLTWVLRTRWNAGREL